MTRLYQPPQLGYSHGHLYGYIALVLRRVNLVDRGQRLC